MLYLETNLRSFKEENNKMENTTIHPWDSEEGIPEYIDKIAYEGSKNMTSMLEPWM
jgi:hypothetical protein